MSTAAIRESGEESNAEVVLPTPRTNRRPRFVIMTVGLTVALAATIVVSLGAGQFAVAPSEVVGILLGAVGIDTPWAPEVPAAAGVLLDIRLPRIVMGLLVGAALAASGVLMQAIFGNPSPMQRSSASRRVRRSARRPV